MSPCVLQVAWIPFTHIHYMGSKSYTCVSHGYFEARTQWNKRYITVITPVHYNEITRLWKLGWDFQILKKLTKFSQEITTWLHKSVRTLFFGGQKVNILGFRKYEVFLVSNEVNMFFVSCEIAHSAHEPSTATHFTLYIILTV